MRITYIGPLPPFRGGIAHHGAHVVRALRAAGHEVDACTWAAQYPRWLYPGPQPDPDADPLPGARSSLRWWDPSSWWREGRRARHTDLLVLPWVTPVQAPAYLTILSAAGRTPAVGIIHNPLPHERRFFDDALTRVVLRRLSGAVAHASTAAADIARFTDLDVAVVPHPPNLPVLPAPLPPRPPLRLLFLGFVRPYKGLDLGIDAVAALRRRGVDVRLTVAGQFWGEVEPWRQRLGDLGIAECVNLQPRYIPDEEVSELLAAHHVVVAPYRSATQSGIVPLAQAAARPVVVTDVGGLRESVADGRTGVVCPPGDAAAFADGIVRCGQDLDRLAAASRERAASWAEVARAVIDVAPAEVSARRPRLTSRGRGRVR